MDGPRYYRAGREMEAEALEEHDRHVDALFAGLDDIAPQPVEVGHVELGEVEGRLAICCRAGAGARPGLRCRTEVKAASGELRPELLPAPQPGEVMAMALEEREIRLVLEVLWWVGALRPRA